MGRSASRPDTNFTIADAKSAAPSNAPSVTAPAPKTPVTNAGKSGYTISLAKSLSSETSPNSLTVRGRRVADGPALLTEVQPPTNQRDGEAAVLQNRCMKTREREIGALGGTIVVPQLE